MSRLQFRIVEHAISRDSRTCMAVPRNVQWRAVQLLAVILLLLLSACAAPRLKPTATLLGAQDMREADLARHDHWTIEGRLGVSDGNDGGSGSIEWLQDGGSFRLSLHAPVTGKTWVLHGDRDHAVLEGLRPHPVEGSSAANLLARELNWQFPVAQLDYWVRGMRAPGQARVVFRADGLPAQIEQDGWTVEYLDYASDVDPPLPNRIFARNGNKHVRLAIRNWTLR